MLLDSIMAVSPAKCSASQLRHDPSTARCSLPQVPRLSPVLANSALFPAARRMGRLTRWHQSGENRQRTLGTGRMVAWARLRDG